MNQLSSVVSRTRDYYNSNKVLAFQQLVYNNSDHCSIGLYKEQESIHEAMYATVQRMAAQIPLTASDTVLDMGAGYGGAARYLVQTSGCSVDCLNLSKAQNKRNRELNRQHGFAAKIRVIEGNFEEIVLADGYYDVVWSQDALLFSSNRVGMLQEVLRVLKPGGHFIFTDPMQGSDCSEETLKPLLQRLHLDSLASFDFYSSTAERLGFEEVQLIDLTEQLSRHYARLLEEINAQYEIFLRACGREYIEHQRHGLQHWIKAGKKRHLNWGILHFCKQKTDK